LKNFYDLLSVARGASADDIKKAFRREIARYHPDKVQHLGPEFQEMAADIAADLTEAYRILMDAGLRAKYDADLQGTSPDPAPRSTRPSAAASSAESPRQPAAPPVDRPPPSAPRSAVGVDFIRRAAMSKIRRAIDEVIGSSDPLPVRGFDIAVVTKGRKGLFKKAEESVCLLVTFVPAVDPAAIAAVWPEAARVNAPGASGCVLMLLGSDVSPAKELAAAVSEQRRRSRGGGPVLVPVDVRDWEALFPPETPASVRSLIQRLKDEKR
jgi:curved DNA-binding protein CbpA